jgi:hypothetical protein
VKVSPIIKILEKKKEKESKKNSIIFWS